MIYNRFVLRTICVESTRHHPGERRYGMVFVFSWQWAALVLATCYAGFLTAMITSPTLYRGKIQTYGICVPGERNLDDIHTSF